MAKAPDSKQSRLWINILVFFVSASLGILIIEGILRLAYPQLPSLSALQGTSLRTTDQDHPDEDRPETHEAARELFGCGGSLPLRINHEEIRFGAGDGDPFRVWFAGDSITRGFGVQEDQAFPTLLAARLAEKMGRPVLLRNLGIPGAGYCSGILQLFDGTEDFGYPDLAVITFFADDLYERTMVVAGDKLVAFPDKASNPFIRTLITHSYLANFVWFMGMSLESGNVQQVLEEDRESHFRDTVPMIVDQLEGHDTTVVVALLAPSGLHVCQPVNIEASLCSALGPAMDRIAELLEQAGVPFVDLRELWEDKPLMVLPSERHPAPGGIGIHPDEAGHRAISEALWPRLEQVLIPR